MKVTERYLEKNIDGKIPSRTKFQRETEKESL